MSEIKRNIIDTHAHLCSPKIKVDRENILERAQKAGVTQIINIATTPQELEEGIMLRKKHPWIYLAAATHPHDAAGEDFFSHFEKNADQLVAIGETGLDYHYENASKEAQAQVLRKYIALSKKSDLPLIIHCREAFSDLFRIFEEENFRGNAVLHCFTGTLEEAQEGVRRGFYISLSGVITFKKSDALREVVRTLDPKRLLIETDCPFLAPQSHRGKENEPAFIVETLSMLASIKGLDINTMGRITQENASRLFKI